jgi:hypothetical protein
MRLIHTTTLEMEEFIGNEIPRYAILSHTWDGAEVSFQEYHSRDPAIQQKSGYSKILQTCLLARADEIKYAWIDTCCIDKASSAELSEAINSMFKWYQSSAVCYVYLSDVFVAENMPSSRWFTRGWTLQELIAPTTVNFYNKMWELLGDRDRFASSIQRVTGIDSSLLSGRGRPLLNRPVAERMSWAASRQTSRTEDIAYCLLGIFNVNMPLLYGEGDKAFQRLQQEIMKESSDLGILAWTESGVLDWPDDIANHEWRPEGRQSPAWSVISTSVKFFSAPFIWNRTTHPIRDIEFSMTNRGIRINGGLQALCPESCNLKFGRCRCERYKTGYFLELVRQYSPFEVSWGIFLDCDQPEAFVRCSPYLFRVPMERLDLLPTLGRVTWPVYLNTDENYNFVAVGTDAPAGLWLPQPLNATGEDEHYRIISAVPESKWNHCRQGFFTFGISHEQRWAILEIEVQWRGLGILLFALVHFAYRNEEVCLLNYRDYRRASVTLKHSADWAWNDVESFFHAELSERGEDKKSCTHKTIVNGTPVWIFAEIHLYHGELTVWAADEQDV